MKWSGFERWLRGLNSWDWKRFFTNCAQLGNQLDGLDWRVVKGTWSNKALERFSNGEFQPKKDQVGFDGLFNEHRIETKGLKKYMFMVNNKTTGNLQVKNTYSNVDYTKSIQNFDQTFDFLLMIQTSPPYKAAITSGISWISTGLRGRKGKSTALFHTSIFVSSPKIQKEKAKVLKSSMMSNPFHYLKIWNPPSTIGLKKPTRLMTCHDLYF